MAIDKKGLETRSWKEFNDMFALNAGVWPVNREDPSEIRDRYHRVALHEALIAAESRDEMPVRASGRSLTDRIRLAIGLAPSEPQCVACAA